MRALGFRVNLIAASIWLCLNFALASELGRSEPPISVEHAIALAKNYAKEHKIDVSKSYIGSAVLHLNPRGDRGPFWLVTWEPKTNFSSSLKAVGGQVLLSVYMDRQIEVRYGE